VKRVFRAATLVAALALFVTPACKKKGVEEVSNAPRPVTQPVAEPAASPIGQAPVAPGATAEPVGPVLAKRTVLDAEVRKIWKSVEFIVREKKPGVEPRTVNVLIGEEVAIEGTPLTIRVVGFVPEFAMDAGSVTTKSMNDVNPAAKVRIIEGGKEIWEGWAFRNYPDQHSFQDPRYAILMTKALRE